ncbi:hypothetical protein H0H87_009816 [Tephrocybe sp. NHM501043]|nr:hypothetical protein H0H87_009816 [Tephrocybe sp. NHM501043]
MAKSKRQKDRRLKARLTPRPAPLGPASFPQEVKRSGLLVTGELEKALQECELRVQEIAEECKTKNRKFRDIEFDLELDKLRCLQGLNPDPNDPLYQIFSPSDVQRVTQIFDKPSFFVDGADSNDIIQGQLGLVERFCVAREEKVGVYGFIFFRDSAWVTVIVDDLLYTSIPKFEELNFVEQQLFHHDKDVFNTWARKNGKSLYFSKSGTNGETWVPLIEKAYAKLHGNYASLNGGETGEAIEDLTGDSPGRLFGCAFNALDTTRRRGVPIAEVNGLIGGHAYSVLRAVNYRDKRFLVIRNPWGQGEWKGPWSDGSIEWTEEWLPALQVLGHSFGNDGQFVMEYKDFLENWEQIDRTLLFDESWKMSSHWLEVTTRMLPTWTYGDVSYTVIVLSKLDDRYWKPISGSMWSFDFLVYKKGETKPRTSSSSSLRCPRSVNAEVLLEAGEYVVHVRLDRLDYQENSKTPDDRWERRTLLRVMTEQFKSQAIVSNTDPFVLHSPTALSSTDNYNNSGAAENLPVSLDLLAGHDLAELEIQAAELLITKEQETGVSAVPESKTDITLSDSTSTPTNQFRALKSLAQIPAAEPAIISDSVEGAEFKEDMKFQSTSDSEPGGEATSITGLADEDVKADQVENEGSGANGRSDDDIDEETGVVFLGLRVYTNKAAAKVGGQLRHTSLVSLAASLGKSGKVSEPL